MLKPTKVKQLDVLIFMNTSYITGNKTLHYKL